MIMTHAPFGPVGVMCVLLWVLLLVEGGSSASLVRVGLVADNHYDTFPVGEKAPWQPMSAWLTEQRKRSTWNKRRYDIAKDKMLESIDVFNRANATFVVNLGDLVNNDLMWNLRPILDAFNTAIAPHFSLLGNHDLRAHNDRFGKNNATQERWMRHKLGLGERWYYAFSLVPFHFVFIDSMVLEERGSEKCAAHLQWIAAQLAYAANRSLAVVIFGHIAVGVDTNAIVGPILKSSGEHIVAAFFGHDHKGGYTKQGHLHTVILHGQIETLVNAFALVDFFDDRAEFTGFGRVPTRVLHFSNAATVAMIRSTMKRAHNDNNEQLRSDTRDLSHVGNTPLPPDKLWANEVPQAVPHLNLDIPTYRKPILQPAQPNPGDTQFAEEYKLWPRRVLTHAPEAPVDLTSYRRGKPTWLSYGASSAAAGSTPTLLSTAGTDAQPVTASRPSSKPLHNDVSMRQVPTDPELNNTFIILTLTSFCMIGGVFTAVRRRRRAPCRCC